ncbi:hypothetical protein JCM11491_002687 [Sporobolomyces phaffii]
MPTMFRKPAKEVSPSTQLVQQLYSFGLEPDASPSDSTSSRRPSLPEQPEASTSTLAPPIPDLGSLSLGASAPPSPKVNSSLRKLLKSTEHSVELANDDGTTEERVLTSWKMADYAYKRDPCPFPTRARGLFTEKLGGGTEYRIVARGYDKFFNVNEVSWTQWNKIPEYSTGPYELTTKSNGCIILIAALSPTHLIVTSKHSIGKNANLSTEGSVSHSERGEYWLEQHLAKVGKTKRDLARDLFERNLTAVAELCDDSFEEHVLPYPTEQTGLHLHGLNHNTPLLNTLPSSEVSQFAKTYGMIPTAYFVFPSVVAVKTYCETVEQTGGVEFTPGVVTPVEGFVVRGKRRGGDKGEAFFWKVKYDEPYLMYREWRELTRKCLATYPDLDALDPKRIKNSDSRLYLWWVKREMARDVTAFESWKHGKGMIKTREEFLAWQHTSDGTKARRELGEVVELDEEEKKNRKFDKTIIVPVAIQGCGKTAIGLELHHLFGFAHVQSDDFLVKKPTPHFLRKIRELLKDHDVVYADKNNHQVRHRLDLVELVNSLASTYRIRLVALVYPVDSPTLPRDKFHALMASRIVARGENHQSLRAGESHEAIVWQFLGQHEPFDDVSNAKADGKFDRVVAMRPDATRDDALADVVRALGEIDGMGVVDPGADRRRAAVEWARAWKVQVKKATPEDGSTAIKKRQPKAAAKPRYYGLAVDVDLRPLVEAHVVHANADDSPPSPPPAIWTALVESSRVETKPHVTLVHQVELASDDEAFRLRKQGIWNRYERMVHAAQSEGATADDRAKLEVQVTLGPRLVWNERAMAIEVSSVVPLAAATAEDPSSVSPSSSSSGEDSIALAEDRSGHITVGTRSSDIRPIEGKWLMENALLTDPSARGEIHELRIGEIKVKARLAGLS